MRPILVNPPAELQLSTAKLLRIEKPLYGLRESGVHWFLTYRRHHMDRLKMKSTAHDLCLLYTPNLFSDTTRPRAMTCLQTDVTISLCNTEFENVERHHSKRFISKPAQTLKEEKRVKFNGVDIQLSNHNIIIDANDHQQKLKKIRVETPSIDEFVSERSRGAYIAALCCPDLCFSFAYAAQCTKPSPSDARALNKVIGKCIESKNLHLQFVPLEISSLHIATFIDASFARNADHTSQLGFVICAMDAKGYANILHYGSSKA